MVRIFRRGIPLILISMALGLPAQNINGVVVSRETLQPVSDVFIFIDNTSVGTTSDQHGHFTITIPDGTHKELVFSHLNFDIKLRKISSLLAARQDTFYLFPKKIFTAEAVVKAKANKRVWKNRLKRFREAFIGNLPEKLVTIENAEVLIFEETSDHLHAQASEPLQLRNEYLGYEVTFFLDQFMLRSDGATDYAGKVFFKELAAKKKELARFKRNRTKVYQRSSRRFFQELIKKDFEDISYQINRSKFMEEENKFTDLQEIGSLDMDSTEHGYFEIEVADYLSIVDLNTIERHQVTARKGGKIGMRTFENTDLIEAVSHLRPRSGKIIFDRSGLIQNAKEVEEYGYWAGLRVGSLLPLDYQTK